MAPRTFGSRLGRAVALMLFFCPAVVRADNGSTPPVFVDDPVGGGAVISDSGPNQSESLPPQLNTPYSDATPPGSFPGPSNDNIADGQPCGDDWGAYQPTGACDQHDCAHGCPVWFGAEWIHWRLTGDDLPPLVTAGPAVNPINTVARLDDPDTIILAGDEGVNDEWREGYRIFAGIWCDCCHSCGVGIDYFNAGDNDFDFSQGPVPGQVIGRPFFNTETGQDDVQLVSVPGELDGTVTVNAHDDFQGAGITINQCISRCCNPCTGYSREFRVLSGYRFYEFDSDLAIREFLTVLPGTTTPLVPGTMIAVEDEFKTHNEFHGGEIGLQGSVKHNCWWYDGTAKLAIGANHRTVTVDGETVVVVPGGGSAVNQGGLLTSEVTNIGHYHDVEAVVIPEFRLGVGRQVTKHCAIHAGYNAIVWGNVARAGAELPPGLRVDPRNLPPVQPGGGPDPAFPGIRGSQMIAHGLDLGVIVTF